MRSPASGFALVALVACTAVTPACGPSVKELPPLGEVLVIVDTDMPVPRIVSRLRVDVYTAQHTWYVSRDIPRTRTSDWPASFSVYVPDDTRELEVLLRLRAYPQGEVRDYRGERFAPRPTTGDPFAPAPVPPPTDQPRIVSDEFETTPTTEPTPSTAIDRLVRLRVKPGVRSSARILLHGSCVGTMADLANETTCIETEDERVSVKEEPTVADMTLPTTSRAGTFDFAKPCTATPRAAGFAADGTPLYDEEVCVDGTLFVFGSNTGFGHAEVDAAQKRIAILPPFRIDRYEVTVGRWRDALARGFWPTASPVINDEPIPRDGTLSSDGRSCPYTTRRMDREDYPVACVTYASARAFCQWSGGDLPTEAQWEYVAMEAGRPFETPFPWGGAPGLGATCEQAIYGRGALPINNECNKDGQHYGLVSVRESAKGDVSLGLGVVGMTGSVSEMLRDAYAPLDTNCWHRQPLAFPFCNEPAKLRSSRGASFTLPGSSVFPARRMMFPADIPSSEVGLRCVRSGT